MNGQQFSDLMTAAGEVLKVSVKCESDAEAYLEVGGFNIGVLLDTRLNPAPLRCYFDLGEVAPSDVPQVCQRLLTANLVIGSVGYGVFAWHEESLRPVMVLLLPDAELLDGVVLAQLLQDCTAQCSEVRDELILSRKQGVSESVVLPKPEFGVVQYG